VEEEIMDVVLLILSVVAIGIGFVGVLELLKDLRAKNWIDQLDDNFEIDVDPDENGHS